MSLPLDYREDGGAGEAHSSSSREPECYKAEAGCTKSECVTTHPQGCIDPKVMERFKKEGKRKVTLGDKSLCIIQFNVV